MPQLRAWAERTPDKTAYCFPQTGERVSFLELDRRSRWAAHWLISEGLEAGDNIAVLMENHPKIFEVCWAARRAGLYYTVISTHLKPEEIGYLLKNSDSTILITSRSKMDLAAEGLAAADVPWLRCFVVDGGEGAEYPDYDAAIAPHKSDRSLPPRPIGRDLLYSSGTTGQPKGVRKAMIPVEENHTLDPEIVSWKEAYGFDEGTVYLSTAPLYHAAPLRYVMRTIACGATSIVLGRFDPRDALSAIETYGVTHSQWVPTMFVRLLDLPEEERRAYDVSSMRMAVHSAAPCPVHIKEQMIDWWGPVLYEYYAGSEAFGMTVIGSQDWLRHKGSVGLPLFGKVHILDDEGQELPPGEVGMIYFSGGPRFEYHNAPEKTRGAYRGDDMATYGDLGYLDEDGFLFLSDRRTDLIISGGVNIYPKEIEDVLQRHPAVADSAVIGVPNIEFGEEVKAFVQVNKGLVATDELGSELIDFCRERISNVKCPKTVEFLEQLPRQENGKLPRRLLKERYLPPLETKMRA